MKGTIHSLCPMDPIEAGETYRMEKYKDLEFRARVVKGAKDDRDSTRTKTDSKVNGGAVRYREERERGGRKERDDERGESGEGKGEEREWWKDGEYDAERADKANDLGSRCLKMAKENKNKRNNSAQRIEYEHAFEGVHGSYQVRTEESGVFCKQSVLCVEVGEIRNRP